MGYFFPIFLSVSAISVSSHFQLVPCITMQHSFIIGCKYCNSILLGVKNLSIFRARFKLAHTHACFLAELQAFLLLIINIIYLWEDGYWKGTSPIIWDTVFYPAVQQKHFYHRISVSSMSYHPAGTDGHFPSGEVFLWLTLPCCHLCLLLLQISLQYSLSPLSSYRFIFASDQQKHSDHWPFHHLLAQFWNTFLCCLLGSSLHSMDATSKYTKGNPSVSSESYLKTFLWHVALQKSANSVADMIGLLAWRDTDCVIVSFFVNLLCLDLCFHWAFFGSGLICPAPMWWLLRVTKMKIKIINSQHCHM